MQNHSASPLNRSHSARMLSAGAVAWLALGIVSAGAAWPEVTVKVSGNLISKAQSVKPPATAKQKKSTGKGQTAFSTANPKEDGDSMWVEQFDLNNDGATEETEFLFDDEDKVLYAYGKVACDCAGGGRSKGGLLYAIYCKDNPRNKPAGSGWWVAALDVGECGAKAATLFGSKFDAKGQTTASGIVVLDAENDDIIVAVPKK